MWPGASVVYKGISVCSFVSISLYWYLFSFSATSAPMLTCNIGYIHGSCSRPSIFCSIISPWHSFVTSILPLISSSFLPTSFLLSFIHPFFFLFYLISSFLVYLFELNIIWFVYSIFMQDISITITITITLTITIINQFLLLSVWLSFFLSFFFFPCCLSFFFSISPPSQPREENLGVRRAR